MTGSIKRLTLSQKLFCHEYLVDHSAKDAAIRAGYSKKTAYSIGSRLLKEGEYPLVKAYLNKLIKKQTVKTDITADYVLRNIKEIGERCMQKTEVVGKDDKPTGKYVFKDGGALKAQELLGRWLRLFEDDEGRDPTVNVTVMPQIIVKGKPYKPKIGKEV